MTHLPSRRALLRGAAASALALPFAGLATRRVAAMGRIEPIVSPYGKIGPVKDMTTGLPLLQLPEGFTYQSFGWTGDLMADGKPTPAAHDGMAVVRSRYVNGQPELTLIRNHESGIDTRLGMVSGTAVYDRGQANLFEDQNEEEATGPLAGGNTTLIFANGRFTEARPALAGTVWNCAGGPTPWGTWLTCEEGKPDFTEAGGMPHGYVFEVSPNDGETTAVPIKAMGRMDHEAVAMDPFTGALFLTEDDRNQAGLYKFLPADTSKKLGALEQGGTLWMAKVAGEDKADLLTPSMGDSYQLEWVQIDDPDLAPQPFTEAPHDPDNTASGPFVQGRDKGALRMSRLEGAWYSPSDRLIYLVDTSSGVDGEGKIGRGDGSVWTLDPATDRLTCIYQSTDRAAGNNFDNVAVSPRGGVLLCEDGDDFEDQFGTGQRLMGLTPAGETYLFGRNNIMLTAADIAAAGKSADFIAEGDFRQMELAGVTFDPSGRWMFVNIQTPGITFAITGPWERGLL
jgi:secreted PhoX family phosphatase